MNAAPNGDQILKNLEGELRRGSLSQESLRSYLDTDLPVQVRIELEWMLYGIRQIEEHRERLVQHLSAINR